MKESLFWLCGFGKSFDRVQKEVIRCATHKLGVEKLLVLAVQKQL